MEFSHKPVMPEQCIAGLKIKRGGVYVDATLGGGGHSEAILEYLDGTTVIGIDRDADAICASEERLSKYGKRFQSAKANFSEILLIIRKLGIKAVDGVLFDFGVSSFQLDNPKRGFSYMSDASLDMRMDRSEKITAFDVVNGYSEDELERILREYGEEKFSRQIASKIAEYREERQIETTFDLKNIVNAAIPAAAARLEKQHPAKRSFQAIRIEVNGELEAIKRGLDGAVSLLANGGRLCAITFHSLEDRIVKNKINNLSNPCICPRDFPICVCDLKPSVRRISRKPIVPTNDEVINNPRSRSAKLRIAEKI